MRIWAKAGVKTQLYTNCIRKLGNLWMQWKDINKQNTRREDDGRERFSRQMSSIRDIAADATVHQIMSSSLLGKKKKKKKTLNSV